MSVVFKITKPMGFNPNLESKAVNLSVVLSEPEAVLVLEQLGLASVSAEGLNGSEAGLYFSKRIRNAARVLALFSKNTSQAFFCGRHAGITQILERLDQLALFAAENKTLVVWR